jgi:hypothetical protein
MCDDYDGGFDGGDSGIDTSFDDVSLDVGTTDTFDVDSVMDASGDDFSQFEMPAEPIDTDIATDFDDGAIADPVESEIEQIEIPDEVGTELVESESDVDSIMDSGENDFEQFEDSEESADVPADDTAAVEEVTETPTETEPDNVEGLEGDEPPSEDVPADETVLIEDSTDTLMETENDVSVEQNLEPTEVAEIPKVENIQEWLGDVNPNFDPLDYESPYNNNCGPCSLAVWNRLNGYDSEMVASAENIGYNSEMEAITGLQQVEMSPDQIQEYITAQGAGANGIVGIDRAEGPGHWFNVYNDGEKVVAIDGQDGSVVDWPPTDLGDVVRWELSVKKESES